MTLAPVLAAVCAAAVILILGRRDRSAQARPVARRWLQRDMERAGLESDAAQRRFLAIALSAPVILAALAGWWTAKSAGSDLAVASMVALGGTAGWWLPRTWLATRFQRRRWAITSDFPVMLDLLQISMHGGMSLPAAWATVTESLQGVSEGLAREMRQVNLEAGFGVAWARALSAASDRTGVAEFRSLGSLMDQTQRFGVEVSRMLQVLADSLRHEEIQSLEERAHQAAVRVLVPLSSLVLPPTLVLVAGPLIKLTLEAMSQATAD